MADSNRQYIATSLVGGMGQRKQKLDTLSQQTGQRNWGGIFDLIYRKKKERERAVADLTAEM